jgi:DNA-binding CsgD family transcriptional regulator
MAAHVTVASPNLFDQCCDQHRLTKRERTTVKLLAAGYTNKEIAARMMISVNTVKVFIHQVMLKLDVTTRAGIIGRLFADGIWSSVAVAFVNCGLSAQAC